MNLKKITEISPLIVGYLIFLGFFKLDNYYDHWNINISQYLDFSEIMLSFLQDLNLVLFFTLILILQALIGFFTIHSIDQKTQHMIGENGFKGVGAELEDFFENKPRRNAIFLAVITLITFSLFFWFMNLTWLYIAFLLFVQLVAYIVEQVFAVSGENRLFQITLPIALFAFTLCISRYNISQTEKNRIQFTATIEDKTIATDHELIFLGKTNNFIFLYDKKRSKSTILSTNSVSKMTIVNYPKNKRRSIHPRSSCQSKNKK